MTDEQTNDKPSDIVVLEGLEAVRKRPGMYIGSTNERGLRHIVYTVLDRVVDEASAGCARQAGVTILADGGLRVADDGCGLPVEVMGTDGVPGVEAILTTLNCGVNYWIAGHEAVSLHHPAWLYDLGLAVVNALSERLEVEVRRQGHVWRQSYRRGIPDAPLAKGEATDMTGTVITFWADPEIFSTTWYDADILRARFRQLACLSGRMCVTFTDERGPGGEPITYCGDLADYVAYLNQSRNNHPIHEDIIVLEAEDPDQRMKAQVAMQWTTSDEELLETFVNTILTSQGGTHAEGLRDAVTDVVARHAQRIGLREDHDLGEGDVCQGLTAVVNVMMYDPHFAGPTREYLNNPTVRTFVAKVVGEGLSTWLASHPDQAEVIARHVTEVAAIPVTPAMQDAVLSAMDDSVVGATVAKLAVKSGLPSPLVRRTLAVLVKAGRVVPQTEESGWGDFTGRIRYVMAPV